MTTFAGACASLGAVSVGVREPCPPCRSRRRMLRRKINLGDEVVLYGVAGGGASGSHVELAVDRAEMGVDRPDAHDETLRHLRVREPLRDERQHLDLPRAQPLGSIGSHTAARRLYKLDRCADRHQPRGRSRSSYGSAWLLRGREAVSRRALPPSRWGIRGMIPGAPVVRISRHLPMAERSGQWGSGWTAEQASSACGVVA
jgi:hypothetical protein